MATEQDIANILGEIGQGLNRLVKALVENAVFQQNGQIPEDKRAGPRRDETAGGRPTGGGAHGPGHRE
jgi:hypothetical protein